MRGQTLFGVGAVLVIVVSGCSGDDTAPGSKVTQAKAGSGGAAGEAGSISLGIAGGGAGSGGAVDAGGNAGGSNGGIGGAGAGGTVGNGGTTGGSGGAKPMGTCKRAAGTDIDCGDFYPGGDGEPARPQAYACDDTGAYLTLNSAHASKCASVNFVLGAKYGACCPP